MAEHEHTAAAGDEDFAGPVDPGEERAVRRVDEVTGALEQLADLLGEDNELESMLSRVCRQVVHAIPDAESASVSLVGGDRPRTAASTGELAVDLDRAQYEAGEGPCLEAAETGKVVRAGVGLVRRRWPVFVAAAGSELVGSYLSAPLFIDREYHGSLNLYAEAGHGFAALDAALLELYTTAAEAALRSAHRCTRARETAENLERALGGRAVIDQAKGILMAVRRISADDAFALLVARSQRQNVKLRVVAERFVAEVAATEDPS